MAISQGSNHIPKSLRIDNSNHSKDLWSQNQAEKSGKITNIG